MACKHDTPFYRSVYHKLLRLYPRAYRERVEESMRQTFDDLCRERLARGEGVVGFIMWTYADTARGIFKEYLSYNPMITLTKHPNFAALVGFLTVAPFLCMNLLVVAGYKPFIDFLRPEGHTSLHEQILLFSAMFLILIGGVIALLPLMSRREDGKRKFYLLNTVLGALLLLASVTLIYVFGEEVYRADILKIPNSD